ncbi:MAG: RnfABCDGE type electron transport complex subunit C, partial [Clostridia bacterium]|nr:RnfABCDGE type electron transport complex subunit C [Clostridia bacterium]
MKATNLLASVFGVQRGVHAPHCKNTAECHSVVMPTPAKVLLSMQQHAGAPCEPLVKKGDKVAVGQLIGDSKAKISAPIHASVSGEVSKIDEIVLANGNKVPAIEIVSDGLQTMWEGLEPPHVHSKEDFVDAVRASGLVGLGGAGFPAHMKYALYNGTIDTLIINGAECEPYITSDYRGCLENSWDIMNGIVITAEHLGAKRTIIAIENNKPHAIEELSKIAKTLSNNAMQISVLSLPAIYPQGAEKMMVQQATGRKIPPGKLPSDVGCCVMNINSVAFISRYFKSGVPLVARTLTVDGSGIVNPQNVRVRIGTMVSDVIEFCGGYVEGANKIVLGGPMMGTSLYTDQIPVCKQNNAILVFAGNEGLTP